MIDLSELSLLIMFGAFAAYSAMLLAEMWDSQASRWPM
jgi:hypothetical protein